MVGCSTTSGETESGTQTLDFVNDKPWDFEAFSAVSEEQIGIALKPSTYGDQEAFVAFVKQSMRTSKAPGLFTWHTGGELAQLVDEGLIAETTTIWEEEIAAGNVAASVKDLFTINGKQYCTPISVDDWVMYYDMNTFAEFGLTPPTTWDELMEVSDVLQSNGVAPFWTSQSWAWAWFMILTAGTDLQLYEDLSTGAASYTDPRVVGVMDLWLEMLQKGYFSDPGSKTPHATQMKDGDIAMIPFGTWFPGELESNGLKAGTDWGVFPIPAVNPDQGSTPVAIETAPVCVTENSEQRDVGLEYAQWWMGAEAQTAWGEQQGNLSFNPAATASTQTFRDLSAELATPDKYTYYMRYYEATPTDIRTAALDQFTGFVTNPGDPTPYLEAIENVAETYWASN